MLSMESSSNFPEQSALVSVVNDPTSIGRSRLRVVDAFREAAATIVRRPGRTLLTALGTVLGVGTMVATLGVVETANEQVSSQFNALLSTQITVTDLGTGDIPLSSEAEVLRINGVRNAGISWLAASSVAINNNPNPSTGSQSTHEVPVYAATPRGFETIGCKIVGGRAYDLGNERRADRVVVLGTIAANTLGIGSVTNQPAVFLDGVPLTVVGIASGCAREPGALTGIVIPASTSTTLGITSAAGGSSSGGSTSAGQPEVFISTDLGAAQVVGDEVAYAINPRHAHSLDITTPPDPRSLRRQIEGATSSLLLLLAGLSLFIGIVAIANTTLLAVFERVPEIGLRRAVGARSRHIGIVVLMEAAVVGAIGGLIGLLLGLIATAGAAFIETWTAVIDPRVLVLAPVVGVLAGVLAGLYPAWRATRIEPVAALQR